MTTATYEVQIQAWVDSPRPDLEEVFMSNANPNQQSNQKGEQKQEPKKGPVEHPNDKKNQSDKPVKQHQS
jgi:hypothetical protein